MPGGDRGFHLGRRIRAVWLFLVCEWGNRGTEEAFWERAKATQAVSELSRLVPQLSGSQAGWGMTGAGAPGHWLHGGGHRGDPWVSRRTGTAWSKLPLPVGNEQPLGGGARRGSPPPPRAWAGHWGRAGQASSVSLWDTCLRRRLTRESPGGLQALCARSGLCPRSVPRGDLGPASQGQCPGELACPAGFLPGPGAGAPRCLRCPQPPPCISLTPRLCKGSPPKASRARHLSSNGMPTDTGWVPQWVAMSWVRARGQEDQAREGAAARARPSP